MSCKLLEYIIHSNIVEHLDHNNIITEAQDGLSLIDDEQIDSASLDFSKTFGKVSHIKFHFKLHHCGIWGKLFTWVEDPFHNRTQKVVLSGEESACLSNI